MKFIIIFFVLFGLLYGTPTGPDNIKATCNINCLVYDPVCGVSGTTYPCGEVQAQCHGDKVLHDGECGGGCGNAESQRIAALPAIGCSTILCLPGHICREIDGRPQCVPMFELHPCTFTLCPTNSMCRLVNGKARCIPVCRDPCATVRCANGYRCEPQQVLCVKAPCCPVASCVPDCKPPCAKGQKCVMSNQGDGRGCNTPVCIDPCSSIRCGFNSKCVVEDDGMASCEPLFPLCLCGMIYSPVCDANSNTTYANECLAQCHKAEISCNGECPCETCICPLNYDPICGVDGRTYGNPCQARCSGMEIECEGECPCPE